MKQLPYNFHDSIIDKFKFTSTTFSLYLDLNTIYYPSNPKVELSFGLVEDFTICKEWTNQAIKKNGNETNYLGLRIDTIEIQEDLSNSKDILCKIEFDHIDNLNFKCQMFRVTEIKKEIQIDEQLLNICKGILKENLTLQEWTEIESDDMFQTEKYEGGFDNTAQEFVFSVYYDTEYWFQLSLEQINEISEGKLKSVVGTQSGYYD